ncbi:MAG: DUF58 domain-containing protein [Trueperaceae bacterium]|nr:DUF58 domain-containing protein [Trueperaceae bacterium]
MISARSRALLNRFSLASKALSQRSGERMATEAGQSVEFYDFRPYQRGDELRYVDWKVYARTGRLYTRLYQAERNIASHIVLDTSGSMAIGNKAYYARILAQLLSYAAQQDAVCQVHLFNGDSSRSAHGRSQVLRTWDFIETAATDEAIRRPEEDVDAHRPVEAIKRFALTPRFEAGVGLALIISDLFDEAPLRSALVALRARGFDASFLQVVSRQDLMPDEAPFELVDSESGEKLSVGADEARAYRQAVQQFIDRTRGAVLQAGFRHTLLRVGDEDQDTLEREAFAALIREGILVRR